jgi:hypothetical protein
MTKFEPKSVDPTSMPCWCGATVGARWTLDDAMTASKVTIAVGFREINNLRRDEEINELRVAVLCRFLDESEWTADRFELGHSECDIKCVVHAERAPHVVQTCLK